MPVSELTGLAIGENAESLWSSSEVEYSPKQSSVEMVESANAGNVLFSDEEDLDSSC